MSASFSLAYSVEDSILVAKRGTENACLAKYHTCSRYSSPVATASASRRLSSATAPSVCHAGHATRHAQRRTRDARRTPRDEGYKKILGKKGTWDA